MLASSGLSYGEEYLLQEGLLFGCLWSGQHKKPQWSGPVPLATSEQMAVVHVWDSHSYALALIPAAPLLLLALLLVLDQNPEQMIRFAVLNRASSTACFASSVPCVHLEKKCCQEGSVKVSVKLKDRLAK